MWGTLRGTNWGTDKMAYLKRRGDKWFAVWRENGKKVVKATGVPVKGKREEKFAQATADAMEAAAKNSIMVGAALDAVRAAASMAGLAKQMPTIEEFLNNYVPGGQARNRANSKQAFRSFLAFLSGDRVKRLDALLPSTCKRYLEEELKYVSFGTVSRYLISLRSAFNSAVQDGLIERSPFAKCNLQKIAPATLSRKTQRLPFTLAEMAYILTRFPAIWRDMCLLSFATGGQRIGDVCCMQWGSVDFENNLVSFATMKTGKQLNVPMVPMLRQMFLRRREEDDTYVFPVMARTYMRAPGSVSTEFVGLLNSAGFLPEYANNLEGRRRRVAQKSFHSIRHTVVSMLRSSTLFSADIARAIVGHDSEAIERAYFTASTESKMDGLMYLMNEVQKSGEPIDSPLESTNAPLMQHKEL